MNRRRVHGSPLREEEKEAPAYQLGHPHAFHSARFRTPT
jgi:hypothetical protein